MWCQHSEKGYIPCCGQVLGQAVRLGIRFAEALLRMEGFWREHLASRPGAVAAFKAVCEHTSKGTRACQAVCHVAKARKDLAITSKARPHSWACLRHVDLHVGGLQRCAWDLAACKPVAGLHARAKQRSVLLAAAAAMLFF